MKNKRAVLYARVSTQQQMDEGMSIDAQLARMKKYAELQGLEIVTAVREQASTKIPLAERNGGGGLIQSIKAYGASHVIAIRLDRLFRNTVEALSYMEEWDGKIALHLLDMQIDTSTSVGRMIFTVLSSVAQMERERTAERVSEVAQHKKANRKKYTKRVYGFKCVGSQMVEIPEELAEVERMRAQKKAGSTLAMIVEDLMERKIAAPSGIRWYPETVRRILANEIHSEIGGEL